MSRDYPLPSYAASIWIKGDQIWLDFSGHSAPFPATGRGLALLLAVLRERTQGKVLIGENGAPNFYQVERALQGDKRWNEMLALMRKGAEDSAAKAQESEEFLKDLGLL